MTDIACETKVLTIGQWTITRTLKLCDGCACGYCEIISSNGHVLSCVQLNGAPTKPLADVLEKYTRQPTLPPMDCTGELIVLGRHQ